DWSDPARAVPIRKAVIGRISRADGRFVAELESVAASLDRPNGRYLRRNCDARLGDGRCGVDLSGGAFTGAGEVVALTAPATLLADGLSGFEPGWFAFGEITFETGALAGRVMAVIEHAVSEGDVFLTLPADEALWILRCNSIHTFFMMFPIDCVFVNRDLEVKALRRNVVPWRMVFPVWGASSVIEMAAGNIDRLDIRTGEKLHV
ncbi:MAG TPA: DUF192 domain-containing protein, partial [Pseudobdellovibrionaceae bacterium]|nr:DUF192 domain-containing protein [Pseudobdellovibrionaceae bacterium]